MTRSVVLLSAIALAACESSTAPRARYSIAVLSPAFGVAAGSSMQLGVDARDTAWMPVAIDTLVWSVAPTALASISPAGVLTGIAVGQVTVTARALGVVDTRTFWIKANEPLFQGVFSRIGNLCQLGDFSNIETIKNGRVEFMTDTLAFVTATSVEGTDSTTFTYDQMYYELTPRTGPDSITFTASPYGVGSLFAMDSIIVPKTIFSCLIADGNAKLTFVSTAP